MRNNPYVGPRPYERGDRHNFYGRNREARDLLSLILSERVVLFYAQSGAGKTSLLNAQIIPALEKEGFNVLPVARVGGDLPPWINPQSVGNIFVYSAFLGLAERPTPKRRERVTLAATLTDHTLLSYLREHLPVEEPSPDYKPPILILDQFEEILTTHRDRWQDVEGFFRQLAEALDALPTLGLVCAMREGHVAGLEPYAPLVPGRLRAHFRIERLGREGATEAVQKPALNAGCPFAPGVAERLVDNLRRLKTRHYEGLVGADAQVVLGPFVEPVQLQVVCRRLWENLPEQPDRTIQWEDVEQFGDIDRALIDFYESGVVHCVQKTGVSERRLRRWFDEQLITPLQTRGLVLRDAKETGGLPNAAVDVLEAHHLIRAEMRAGGRWYELIHDRLMDPILEANRTWEAARQTPQRLAARQWQASGEEGLLYRGTALQEALVWAAAHPADVEPEEQAFLEASQKAEVTRKRRRNFAILGSLAALLVIATVSYLAWAAYQASRIARSRELAATSLRWHSINQEQSILLARAAVEETDTPAAEIALRQALVDFYPSEVLMGTGVSAYSVAYRPDGRFLAAGMSNGDILIWDTETRGSSPRLGKREAGGVWALAYSPDGQFLASSGSDNQIHIWNPGGGTEKTLTGHTGVVYNLAYSPDGRYLASGSRDKTVRIWDLTADAVITLTGHTGAVYSVDYSPDGHWVASAAPGDRAVRVWELLPNPEGQLEVGEVFTLTGHTASLYGVAFSPAGDLLASGSSDKTIRIWDLATREPVLTLVGHTALVRSLAFSDDGRYIISGSRDATVRIWDVGQKKTGAVVVLTGHTSLINSVACASGGRFLASASGDDTVRLWDTRPPQGALLTTLMPGAGRFRYVDFSPDSRFLASGSTDGLAYIWSLEAEEPVMALQHGAWNGVWDARYSPEGDRMVTGADDGVARIWDLSTGSLVRSLEGHASAITAVAYGPDGRHVATASKDRTARVWDTTTGETVQALEGHTAPIYGIAYSPDGRFVATASDDDDVRIWEVRTDGGGSADEQVLVLSGHTHDVFGVAFSPDGKHLASASWDQTVRIWELRQGSGGTLSVGQVITLAGHSGYVYQAAYSPNGRYLVTSSWDRTVRLWDLSRSPPETIAILPGHTERVTGVAYSPDGKYLASAAADGTIRRYLANFADVWALSWEYVPRTMTPDERFMLLGESP